MLQILSHFFFNSQISEAFVSKIEIITKLHNNVNINESFNYIVRYRPGPIHNAVLKSFFWTKINWAESVF